MVIAADDVADLHQAVIDHDGQVEHGVAVGFDDDKVVEFLVVHAHGALQHVGDFGDAG